MSGAQLRALAALAVVLLASASVLAQDAQQNSSVAATNATTSPLSSPSPANSSSTLASPSPAAAAPSTPAAAVIPTAAEPAPAPAAPAPETPTTATPAPEDSSATPPQQEAEQPPAESSPPPEDPCKKIPGCVECIPASHKARKLMQNPMGGALGGGLTVAGRPLIDWSSIVKSPYDEPDAAYCTKCSGDGYLEAIDGKCRCAEGYGDEYPTGRCNLCSDGFISRGGFRAVCEECQDSAWSNAEKTLCICMTGYYGFSNTASRQATCNQCPGTRPVSKEGSRSASECMACPAGQKPDEIYSTCVEAAPASPPPPRTLGDMISGSDQPPSAPPAPPAPPLFNSSTFKDAKKDWVIQTRATENVTNPFTDLIGSVVESMIMGRNVSDTAQTPGDFIYQILTKPPPSAQKVIENVQNVAALGAGIGAAASALPAVAKALGTDTPLGGLVNTAAQGLSGLASNMRQAAPGVPQVPATSAPSGGGVNLEMIGDLLGQLSKKPAGDSTADASANPLAGLQQLGGQLKTMATLAKFANALKPAAPAPAAALVTPVSTAASTIVKAAKFLSVPKTDSGFIKVPSAPPKVASAVNPLKLLAASGSKAKSG